MARIYGTIESLKSLKSKLDRNGIDRFNSVKEINHFLSNFTRAKATILQDESKKLDEEYHKTCSNLTSRKQEKDFVIKTENERIDNAIISLVAQIDSLGNKNYNFLKKLWTRFKLYSLNKELKHYTENRHSLIGKSIKNIEKRIQNDEIFINQFKTEKESLIKNRAKSKISKLEHAKEVLENSKNLISGAIGENLVVKEIKKLSNDYVLINDFNLSFSHPIFYKKQNQRIYSIQIDHLLISKAGIFIIETKNWSKSSVNSLNLRSPIEQIERSNFGLYVFISNNVSFPDHHWGEQTVPIRNVIVMIKHKPKGYFKYVSVKLLNELNNYITYFEPVLTDKQFERLVNQLR